jgi:hypothetical protein
MRNICPPTHKHGETKTCYCQHLCGCDECRQAATDQQYWYKNMKRAGKYEHPNPVLDGTGTRRRLQALAYMGWSTNQIGELVGLTGARIRQLMYAETVGKVNADKVRDVYRKVWGRTPPPLFHTNRVKAHARRMGWVGPLHWNDPDTDPEPITTPADTTRAQYLLEDLNHLRQVGESPDSAAKSLGRKPASLARLAARHNHHDLARWIEQADRTAA